jgi:hypothetical protein
VLGRLFGDTPGTVYLAGAPMQVLQWTDNSISFLSDGQPGSRTLFITTASGIDSNTVGVDVEDHFTVSISGIDPAELITAESVVSIAVEPSRPLGKVNYRLFVTTSGGPLLIDRSDPINPIDLPEEIEVPVRFLLNGDRELYLEVYRLAFSSAPRSAPTTTSRQPPARSPGIAISCTTITTIAGRAMRRRSGRAWGPCAPTSSARSVASTRSVTPARRSRTSSWGA